MNNSSVAMICSDWPDQKNGLFQQTNMKILITGTEGYIGSRLAPLLVAAGHEVAGSIRGSTARARCT